LAKLEVAMAADSILIDGTYLRLYPNTPGEGAFDTFLDVALKSK
jgi:hypothetical protein